MTVKMGCGICDARWEIGTPRTCKCNDSNVSYSGRLCVDATTGGFRMGPLPDGIKHSEEMSVSSDNTLRLSGFSVLPKPAGAWQIGGSVYYQMTKKPIWLHRIMARVLLGWEWRDEK
jgi:hypothetical protein